eukprot:PhF_6_TR41610/c0_g1_i1/m.63064
MLNNSDPEVVTSSQPSVLVFEPIHTMVGAVQHYTAKTFPSALSVLPQKDCGHAIITGMTFSLLVQFNSSMLCYRSTIHIDSFAQVAEKCKNIPLADLLVIVR